jgi:hypothetical protein
MLWLAACEADGSDQPGHACPPVVGYSASEQSRVADEIEALPTGAVIIDWLADYAVLRDQARACLQR